MALIATAPLWGPVAVVLLATEVGHLPAELRFRRQMKAAGRYLPPLGVPDFGTIIHDSPTIGWSISRLWWTADELPAAVGTPERTSNGPKPKPFRWHPFDQVVTEKYLDEKTGTAMLIAVWHPYRRLVRLQRDRPNCKVVNCWSGGAQLEALESSLAKLEREERS